MRKRNLLLIAFAFSSFVAFAQGPPPPPPPGLPIDGGIFFLIAAGIAYGVKKLRA